jgi:hypothetical protein
MGERQLVVKFEHGGQQFVLAFEVVVERALRDSGASGNLIDADPAEALSIESLIRGVKNATTRSVSKSGHMPVSQLYTT